MPKQIKVEIESRATYHIMWLAGVRNVALDQHCLKSFGQPDRPRVDARRRHQVVELPEQNPPLAWYLCALPNPWKWSDNAHLAFEAAPGEQWEGPALVRGLHVRLDNARPITGWGEHSIPASEPRRNSYRFRTCRNYQFAWWLRQHRHAPEAPPEYTSPQRPGQGEQMSLME
ncbi:hypothetical protein GR925_01240 [Streptomyces sp. HUCO-GS316]|uniref:hypothetical protein n=1 Tax=Streptomyces sp. HUCO-GS316 TaxID=2692198 RepID=UPI00136CF857|nr:hypothetical protein [Streptomyces sp. HUCO-GS316]MXM62108.1 hypothetical protein [Streptomyces sp. HUCO-GS316]